MTRRRRSNSDSLTIPLLVGAGIGLFYVMVTWAADHPEVFLLAGLVVLALVARPIVRWWRRRQAIQRYTRMLREANIEAIDCMEGRQFEWALQLLFQDLGWQRVELTPHTDYGADLIADHNGVRTVVQAKRYGQPVGLKSVQEVHSARGYYRAQRAMVVTNSVFTPQAEQLAKSTDVELWDRGRLAYELALARRRGAVTTP